jgi:hypothetical protein
MKMGGHKLLLYLAIERPYGSNPVPIDSRGLQGSKIALGLIIVGALGLALPLSLIPYQK